MQRVGVRMTASMTAGLAGVATAAFKAQNAMIDLGNQARVAGTTARQFKVMAIAAREVGIEQEKLSDILKDVNDKFGDFAQTGAGPLKDFFEQIAPQVGITQEAFEGLSSSDALALYVKSLEEANLSQADMTFYMEAIASDATALLPILTNNAAALGAVAKQADAMGLAINDKTIAAAAKARAEFRIMSEVLRTNLQASLVKLIPVFQQMASSIVPMVEGLSRGITSIADAFMALTPETQRLAAGLALAAAWHHHGKHRNNRNASRRGCACHRGHRRGHYRGRCKL